MTEIQRYEPWPQEWPTEDPNGDLVTYEDHRKIVDTLQARAEQLAATNERLEAALREIIAEDQHQSEWRYWEKEDGHWARKARAALEGDSK